MLQKSWPGLHPSSQAEPGAWTCPRLQRQHHPLRWSHSAIKRPFGELPRCPQKRDPGMEVSAGPWGRSGAGPGPPSCHSEPWGRSLQTDTSCAAAQPWAGLELAVLEDVQGLHLLSGSHPPQQLASSEKGLFPSGARAKGDLTGSRPHPLRLRRHTRSRGSRPGPPGL